MALDTAYSITTTYATSTNEPPAVCGGPFGKGVWFSFTPPRNGMVTISTCGSDFDTAFQIYSGDCSNLVPVLCSDDNGPACPTNQASASLLVSANTTYLIIAGGYNGASGNLSIVATMPPPPNDQCAGAIELTAGVPVTMNTANATTNSDPVPTCQPQFGGGIWFSFTPSTNGVVSIGTAGSDLNTAMEVYTGTCGELTPLGCSFDNGTPAGPQARVQFLGIGGTKYLILVGGWYGVLKTGNIRILALEGTLANDGCAGAIPMTEGVTYEINTIPATTTGDPGAACSGALGNGVWYTFTPAHNGVVLISTCGSDYDTMLQVFTGNCGALSPVPEGCNDNDGPGCPGLQSAVSFNGTAGTTYRILAGGANGSTGDLIIRATVEAPLANDYCTGAVAMVEGMVYTQSTATATSTGDYFPGNFLKTVWYAFTPATNGIVTISTCGSDYDTELAVGAGNCPSLGLQTDGMNHDNGPACPGTAASVSFRGSAGINYIIAVGGVNGATGTLKIQATVSPPLPNDDCAGAIPLTNRQVYSESTATATSVGDPAGPYGLITKGIWFSFTPQVSNTVSISTCGTDFDTVLEVYSNNCGSLVPVTAGFGHNDQPPCNQGHAAAAFTGNARTTYLILVGGYGGATGNLDISASVPPPVNDSPAGAIPLMANRTYTANTSYATSTNDLLPDCGTNFAKAIWYSFTPVMNIEVTIDTCGSDFATEVEVYEDRYPSFQPVVCNAGNGPACATNRASASFLGLAGIRYYIMAGGLNGVSGNLSITARVPGPPNDSCVGALPLANGVPYSITTLYASSLGDPTPQCQTNFGNSIWFSFTSPSDGPAVISTCGSDFDTVLQVYSGNCASLIPLTCDDDSGPDCTTNQASVGFFASAATKYLILVGGYVGAAGNLHIVASRLPPPANQDCSAAVAMAPGVPYGLNTFDATSTAHPSPVCQTNFSHAIWYTFTPPVSGLVSISTCGSDYDTVLQVFTGTCGSLVPLDGGCNDDGGPGCNTVNASVYFMGTAGVKYWLLVGGYGTNWGNLELTAQIVPSISIVNQGNYVVLSWPTNVGTSLHFEAATGLSTPVFWTPYYYSEVSGTNFIINQPVFNRIMFFRLRP